MVAAGCFLRDSLFAVFVVATCGFPQKGFQSTGQSSGGSTAVHYGSHRGGPPSLASAPYSAVRDAYGSTFVQGSHPYQPVVTVPVFSSSGQASGMSPVAPAGMVGAGMSPGAQAGMVGAGMSPVAQAGMVHAGMSPGAPAGMVGAGMSPGAQAGMVGAGMSPVATVGMVGAGMSPVAPAGMVGAGVGLVGAGVGQASTMMSGLPGAAYVASPPLYVPVEEYSAEDQAEPVTQWTVPPMDLSGAGSDAAESLGDLLPPSPSALQGPTLQSGETSSVTKEAELGNYQQQTEEFGYPAGPAGSGQWVGPGLPNVLVSGVQQGGFRPVSPGKFDWMLMYGLYPPGTYSTFSQNHEAGKDYSQALHYLKEHVTKSHGSGQQKKFFPGA